MEAAWWHYSYAFSAPAHAVLDAEESVKKEAQTKGTCHPPPSPPCAMPLQKKRFWRARWYFCFSCTRVSVCMYCVSLKVSGVALLYTYKGAGGKHLTVIPCSTSSLILHLLTIMAYFTKCKGADGNGASGMFRCALACSWRESIGNLTLTPTISA